ncbi:hypothetical protein JCM8202_001431 [Rhodotorula sphaerocarpa]
MSGSDSPAVPTASTSRPTTHSPRASPQPQPQSSLIQPPTKRIEPGPAAAGGEKPKNLFSNDGSFLERFKKNAVPTADQEKREREEALARKKALEDRFKKRGKRSSAASTTAATAGGGGGGGSLSPSADVRSASPSDPSTSHEDHSKRRRTSGPNSHGGADSGRALTAYEREVRELESRTLKDEGAALRPLMK